MLDRAFALWIGTRDYQSRIDRIRQLVAAEAVTLVDDGARDREMESTGQDWFYSSTTALRRSTATVPQAAVAHYGYQRR